MNLYSLNSLQIELIILGLACTWLLSFVLHYIAFKLVNYKLQPENYNFKVKLISIISPDFLFSDIYKGKLPKVRKKDFIIKINKGNFIFSLILAFIMAVHGKRFNNFEIAFYAYHLVSRISEITYAFYNDVTEGKLKTTTLKPNERLKLAIVSYFEIMLLYSFIYYILDDKIGSYISSLLGSISASTFTLGFGLSDITCNKVNFIYAIILTQIIATINIITLSVASYLGSKDK